MVGSKFLVLSAFLNVLVHCAPSSSTDFVLKESFTPPSSWIQQDAAHPDHPFTLRIDLTQPNYHQLEEQLLAVSDPKSASYGKHLSIGQIHALTAPTDEAVVAVNTWLGAHGFDPSGATWSPSRDRFRLKTTVSKAQEMLNTTYHVWTHSQTKDSVVRTTSWSLPHMLAPHVAAVHPTNCFIRPKAQVKAKILKHVDRSTAESSQLLSSEINPSCKTSITPLCLLEIYKASDYKPRGPHSKNTIGIASFLNQFANIQDLHMFYENFVPAAKGTSFKVVSIKGGLNSQNLSEASTESNLDTQYAFGLSTPISATVFTTKGAPPFLPDAASSENDNEPYLDFVDFLLDNPQDLVSTLSISYVDDEQSVPPSYAQQVCQGFAKLGALGTTVLAASGDGGVGSNLGPGFCISNDGSNRTTFIPTFPASCPFITTVGATTSFNPEVAVKSFGSGGGFSNYFSRPDYQKDAVERYLSSLGNTYKGLYNRTGRGYPDISAQGDNFQTIVSGEPFVNGGTSASTPTVAAIVALLNDARLAAGKSTLGFLNPLLYSIAADALNDITEGSNPGCGTPGFSCTTGWDPVTGLGTPDFEKLLNIVRTPRTCL